MLDLKISIQKASDCTKLTVLDKTGIYNANTNPGGYGAPNPELAEVTAAKIDVTYPGASAAISLDVFPGLPNVTDTGFDITLTNLGITGESLPDGLYIVTYVIDGTQVIGGNNVPFSASITCSIVILCTAECCVDTAIVELARLSCDCKTNKPRIEQILLADVLLDAAHSDACCGRTECFDKTIDLITSLCNNTNCNTC